MNEGADGQDIDSVTVIASTLVEIATSSVDNTALRQLILARAMAVTGAEGSALVLVDGESLTLKVGAGSASGYTGLEIRADSSLSGITIRTGMLLSSEDTANDPRADREFYRRIGAASTIVAPVYGADGILGTLEVMSPRPGAFDQNAVQAMQIMAGVAGLALSQGGATEQVGRVELVPHQALHDTLTDLPNRTLLFDRLAQAVQLAKRQDETLAVLLIDLAGFQLINERFGRRVGDDLLREVARRLRDTLRASDTVARAGEDVFAVLLPGANAIGAVGTAKKIRRAVSGRPSGTEEITPEIRIGISVYPEHGGDAEILLQHAGAALSAVRHGEAEYAIYGST